MQIAKNTVVMLTFELLDAQGNVIEKTDDPIAYLHGGYHGIFPLVDGLPRGVVPSGDPSQPSYANSTPEARVMRLKGYGNAIVPPLAAEFIRAFMEP